MRVVAAGIVAVALPELAIAREQRPAVGQLAEERGVVAVARGEVDRLEVRARKPERRGGALHRLHVQLRVAVLVVLSLEIEGFALTRFEENLERLPIFLARLLDALQAEDL